MKKRTLGFWEIWNMSFGFLGIQFGFALQNANTSRIFETLGASVEEIPILWIAAPVTGLIVQPIVGYMSDRTWTRLGRRRPYFLIGAILSSIALVLMPNSPTFWIAAGMLWIMDASINISMEPFRAFVGDNLPEHQRTKGFAFQSFFIGIGAVAGSMLPYVLTNVFKMENSAPEGVIPDSVKWSFYVGAFVFLVSVLWTVFRTKEYSPEEFALMEQNEKSQKKDDKPAPTSNTKKQQKYGLIFSIVGLIATLIIWRYSLTKELYILGFGLLVTGLLFILSAGMLSQNKNNGLTSIMTDLLAMPKTMQELAYVQFFSWFGLFSMWIYTTQAVTSHVFNSTDTTSQAYNDGADWVSILFTVYNGVAAAVAFLLPVIAKKTSMQMTHLLALFAGGFGLISLYFISDQYVLLLSMIGVGIAWASILSLPYAMLSHALPANKMGVYMGIFNFFIVIPQIVAATILGFIIKQLFDSQPIYAIILGGISMIIAGILSLRVKIN